MKTPHTLHFNLNVYNFFIIFDTQKTYNLESCKKLFLDLIGITGNCGTYNYFVGIVPVITKKICGNSPSNYWENLWEYSQ